MRITRKELAELINNQESTMAPEVKQQLIEAYRSDEEKITIQVEVDWTLDHQAFMDDIYEIMESQGLEIHPKLAPKLRGWIDSTINRGEKCIMLDVRDCLCANPVENGCPLLRKKSTPH